MHPPRKGVWGGEGAEGGQTFLNSLFFFPLMFRFCWFQALDVLAATCAAAVAAPVGSPLARQDNRRAGAGLDPWAASEISRLSEISSLSEISNFSEISGLRSIKGTNNQWSGGALFALVAAGPVGRRYLFQNKRQKKYPRFRGKT